MKLKIEFNETCEAQAKVVANFLVEMAQAKSGVVIPRSEKGHAPHDRPKMDEGLHPLTPNYEETQKPVTPKMTPRSEMVQEPENYTKTPEKIEDGAPTLHEIREMLKLKAKTKKQDILIELKRLKTKSLTAMDKADYPNFFNFLQQL